MSRCLSKLNFIHFKFEEEEWTECSMGETSREPVSPARDCSGAKENGSIGTN